MKLGHEGGFSFLRIILGRGEISHLIETGMRMEMMFLIGKKGIINIEETSDLQN